MGVGLAAVEEGDLVAAGDRIPHHWRSDEAGAAENEDREGLSRRALGSGAPGKTEADGTAGEDRKLDEVSPRSGHGRSSCRLRRTQTEYTDENRKC